MNPDRLIAELFAKHPNVPGTDVRATELRAAAHKLTKLTEAGPIPRDSKKLHQARKLAAQIRLLTVMQVMAVNATNAHHN